MRTLSTPTQTEIAKTYTDPGYLVEIAFSTVVRLSSRADVSWNGSTWLASNVRVDGLSSDGQGAQTGVLTLGNADNVFGALVLNEGVAGRAIKVWKFYDGATAAADPVQVFSGWGDEAEIGLTEVRISLVSESLESLSSPRNFINKANGFNHLPPAGTIINWGGQAYRLEGVR